MAVARVAECASEGLANCLSRLENYFRLINQVTDRCLTA